jgi:glycosyltransferase involved in cell wall biosynthesis
MPASPIKILLWSPRGSGEHYNGPASFTYRLYSDAPAGRVRVTLAHGTQKQGRYPIFEQQHYISDLGDTPFKLMRFIRQSYHWLDDHVKEFDVMHSISAYHQSVLPAVRAQRLGIPSVVFVSNHNAQLADKSGPKNWLRLARKRRSLVKELAGLIAMSQAIYEELRSYDVPEEKIARIPMGINTSVFHPPKSDAERRALRSELGWLDLPTLIFVGVIVRRKRPDLLVEAIGLLKRRGLDCQLALVGPEGDPTYVRQMKRRATELNVENHIVWVGFTRQIAPLFRAADMFGLPSANEGMSAALIEAMASGLPPIVTPVSGNVDAVEDGVTGRIVQPDAELIADALSEYILNPQLADDQRRAARCRVEQRFSSEYVFGAYERLFRRIMSGGPAAE